jgi:uncharacterized membrane protein YphA (DoxX/SURF4 family)
MDDPSLLRRGPPRRLFMQYEWLVGACGAALISIPGVAPFVGGAKLASLGGSYYYVIVGMAMLATAVLIGLRNRLAPLPYMAFCIGTILWAPAEADRTGASLPKTHEASLQKKLEVLLGYIRPAALFDDLAGESFGNLRL